MAVLMAAHNPQRAPLIPNNPLPLPNNAATPIVSGGSPRGVQVPPLPLPGATAPSPYPLSTPPGVGTPQTEESLAQMLQDYGVASLKGAVLGTPILFGLHSAMNWLDGGLGREGTPGDIASSRLAKLLQTLDNWGPIATVGNWLDGSVGRLAVNRPGLQTIMGQLPPDENEARILKNEYQRFREGTTGKNYPSGFLSTTALNNRGLDDVLTKNPTEFPAWAKDALFKHQVMNRPEELSDDALRRLYDHVAERYTGRLPGWAKSEDVLQASLNNRSGKAMQWLRNNVGEVSSLQNEKVFQNWFSQQMQTHWSKQPNAARHIALNAFKDWCYQQAANVKGIVTLQDQLNDARGGWTRLANHLPLNNFVRNRVRYWTQKETEAQASQKLAQRVKQTLENAKQLGWIDEKYQSIINDLDSTTFTSRKQILGIIDNADELLKKQAQQNRHLMAHLEGFSARINAILKRNADRYRQDFQAVHALSNTALRRQNEAEHLVNGLTHLTAEQKTGLIQGAIQGEDAVKPIASSLKLSEEVTSQLTRISQQQNKALKGLSRGAVGLYANIKRIINGEAFLDFFDNTVERGSSKTVASTLWQSAGKQLSHYGKFILPTAFILAPAFMSSQKAEGTDEKFKSFARESIAGGLFWTMGWIATHAVDQAFDISRNLLRGNSTRTFMKLPLVGRATWAGVAVELAANFFFAEQFRKVGLALSDFLFGKPLHVQLEEAKEKQRQATEQAERNVKQSAINQQRQDARTVPLVLPTAATAPLLQQPQIRQLQNNPALAQDNWHPPVNRNSPEFQSL